MRLTLIVAETIAANFGLRRLAMNAREFMQLDVVVLSILLYALLGKLAESIARLLGAHDTASGTLQSRPAQGAGQVHDIIVRALLDEASIRPSPGPWRRPKSSDQPPGGVSVTTKNLAKAFGHSCCVLHGIDMHAPLGPSSTSRHRQGRLRQEHVAAHPGRPRSAGVG